MLISDNYRLLAGMSTELECDPRIFAKVSEIVSAHNIRGVPLTANTKVAAEFGIDSVAMLDLIMEIEDAFDVSLPINQLTEIETMGDLVRAIEQLTGRAGNDNIQ